LPPTRQPGSPAGLTGRRRQHCPLRAAGSTPIDRWGTLDDVGQAVAALASGRMPFTTGAAIEVDGGMHIHHY
jgi:NAD(P)-dependent dehydrogenase (short-subunit alcohol dehydrogenase family)